MPKFLRILQNCSTCKGLVNISASWLWVSINFNKIFPHSTWSLRKWCLTSICLVRECKIEFLDKLIALVLLHNILIVSNWTLYSCKVCLIHKICAQYNLAAIYSTSVVESATQFYFLLNQNTREWPRNWHVSLVLFLSVLLPAKSASLYLNRSKLAYLR